MFTLSIRDIKAITEASFGCWISALWGFIAVYNEKLEFIEHKEVFFILLRQLLDEERVVLFPPIALSCDDGRPSTPCRSYGGFKYVWAISPAEMIGYLRAHWPQEASDANDGALNAYWYSEQCPQIGWVDEKTGEIVAS